MLQRNNTACKIGLFCTASSFFSHQTWWHNRLISIGYSIAREFLWIENYKLTWYTAYLSVLFPIASCLFSISSFLFFLSQFTFRVLHLYWNSLVCLAVLFSGIIPKTISNCIIAFFDPLTWKNSTHAVYANAMTACLEY